MTQIKIMVAVDDLKPLVSRALEEPRFPEERAIAERIRQDIVRAEKAR